MKKYSKLMLIIFFLMALIVSFILLQEKNSSYNNKSDKIVVALVYPKTGIDQNYGQQFYKAAILAQTKINNSGGINGKELKIITIDSENSPVKAKSLAEDIVKNDDVLCVIADSNNNCADSASEVYEKAHIPQITPVASSDEFTLSGLYQFSASSSRSFSTKFDVEYIISDKLNSKSAGIIYVNNNWANKSLKVFENKALEKNLEIRAKEPITKGQTNFKLIIKRIRQTNPDVLYILADYDETIKCLQTVRIERWDVPVVVTGSYVTEQNANIIRTGFGKVISRRYSSLDNVTQEKENFIYEYRNVAKYSDMELGMQVYDTVMMVAAAAEIRDDNLSRKSFRESLLNLKAFNGLLGEISFDKSGMAIRPFYVVEYKRQHWETIITSEKVDEIFDSK